MVRSKEDYITALKSKLGEDVSDEALSLIEDFSDTYDDMSSKASDEWKTKYEENDKMWRKRYADRFSGSTEEKDDISEPDENIEKGEDETEIMIEDLFE